MTAWIKLRNERRATSNGAYVNIENGSRVGVREYSLGGNARWEVWLKVGVQAPAETLADGYESPEEALSALDEFMAETDYRQLQPPRSAEEKADDVADDEKVEEEI